MATAIITRTYEDHDISYNADGWFNATQAAAKFGKVPYEWQRLPETASYIAGLERKYGEIPYLKTKRGNNGGTWLHPKLAVMFSRWLDVDFAIWCDEQIDDIARGVKEKGVQRENTRQSNIVENAIIQATRADLGKETTAVHYMSEAKMVNFVALGDFIGYDRDTLTAQQLALLSYIEVQNGVMYARGVAYVDRKARLLEMAEAWKARKALKAAPKQVLIN